MTKNFPLDIVIPVHKKDLQILEYCIDAAKKKIVGARRIIIISKERYTNNAEWFDEALFPFSFSLVADYVGCHAGWYFQQLLKMYAPLVIPNISENVMILDSDTVFFRRVKMIDEKGRPFYNISKDTNVKRKDFDQRVAKHVGVLLPDIAIEKLPQEFQKISGISHNMIFNGEVMRDLFSRVEKHDGSGEPFYKIFLKHADNQHSVSEYQIYFNFLLIFYREKIRIRKLRYKNTADINIRKYRRRLKYHYCSFHSYLRGTRTNSLRVRFEKSLRKNLSKLFYREVWNIGIAKCNIADFLQFPNQKIHWLHHLRCRLFRADPFGFISKNGEKNILFEYYDHFLRKGEIRAATLDDNLKITKEKIILQQGHHLSYPYIFSDGKQKFALVESYKAQKMTLYEVSDDASLTKVKDFFEGMKIVDQSIVKHNGKWWLFFTQDDHGNEKLYLASADNLEGEWKMHPQNPIKNDMTSARCGGEIFSHNGDLFRPSQNCSKTYGGSVVINKITALDEENFSEKEEIEIFPNQLGQCPDGLHHIASLGENLTLIDGKRKIFMPHKPVISLLRNLRRIF